MAGARASESIGSHGPHGTRDNGGSHSYHHGQNGESHSPMWRRSTCMLGKPMLGGVKHGQGLFMPVSSLRKKNLDAPTKQFVQKCSRPKMAATKNLKTKVLAPGGDNVAYKGSCRTSRAQPDGWAAFAEVEQRAAALQVSELSPVQLFYESQDFFECLRLARTSERRAWLGSCKCPLGTPSTPSSMPG